MKKPIDKYTPSTYIEITKVFVETPVFTEDARKKLQENDLRGIQLLLTINPTAGTLIPDTKGLYERRFPAKGHGKRGGARIIYYWAAKSGQILLLYLFPKNETKDLTKKQYKQLREYVARGNTMNEQDFNRLMEGVKQGAEYLKGGGSPSRLHKLTVRIPDIKGIREKLKVSQSEFAKMIGISVRTLQNWEQKRRVPDRPSRILLELAAAYPKEVQKVSRRIVDQEMQESKVVTG